MLNLQNLSKIRSSWVISTVLKKILSLLSDDSQALLFFGNDWISDQNVLDRSSKWDRRTIQPWRCYNFDWNNDYVEFDYISEVTDDTAFWISFWIKATETSSTQRIIQNIENSNSRFGVSIAWNNMSVWYYDWSSYSQVASCSFTNTTATFVSITHDTDWTMTIKINDVLQTLWTASPSLTWWTGFRFGDSTGISLLGKLRGVKVYNWVATEEEQTRLYKNQSIDKTFYIDCDCDEWEWVRSYSKNWVQWEMKNTTLTSFHSTDIGVWYSNQNNVWYINSAGLLLYKWATKWHPNQDLAYKTNPSFLRTTSWTPSSIFTATTKYVISCRVKVNSEGANSANANHCVNMPYWYLQIRWTGQQYVIRVDTSASAYVSFDYAVTGERERKHVIWYVDPITTTTKLYINWEFTDLDTRTITGTLSFRQDDIYIWYWGWSNANVTLADVKIFAVTGVPTDSEAISLYNGIDPSGRTKHHHLKLDWDIIDTGSSSEVRLEDDVSVFVEAYKEYTGKVPLDFTMIWSHCANFDWIDDYISIPSLVWSETIISYWWTATPSVVAGRINATAWTLYNVKLSNWSQYPLAEGKWNTHYDVVNGIEWTATGITELSYRWQTQDQHHYNLRHGFKRDTGVKIPANIDWVLASDWTAITNEAGVWHNWSETKIKAPLAPSLISTDTDWILFDWWVQKEIWYSDIMTRENHHAISNWCTITDDWRLRFNTTKSFVIWPNYPFTQATSFTIWCKFKIKAFPPATRVAWVFGSAFDVWIRIYSDWYMDYSLRWDTYIQNNYGTLSLDTDYDYYITYDHTTQKYYFYMNWVVHIAWWTNWPATFSTDDWQISRYVVRWWTSDNATVEVERARIYDKFMTVWDITEDREITRRLDWWDNLVWQWTWLDYTWDKDNVIQVDCVVPSRLWFADISERNKKKSINIYDTKRDDTTTPKLEEVQSLLNHI